MLWIAQLGPTTQLVPGAAVTLNKSRVSKRLFQAERRVEDRKTQGTGASGGRREGDATESRSHLWPVNEERMGTRARQGPLGEKPAVFACSVCSSFCERGCCGTLKHVC